MGNFIDLTGETFGRLVVIRRSTVKNAPKSRAAMWECLCRCGKKKVVNSSNLRSGITKSCGCLAREKASKRIKTHGLSRTTEYKVWHAMNYRCTNPKAREYKDYGGRGIKVCDRWKNSFECFLNDMGKRPANRSLDRIDNEGNYEPGNCRWATAEEQQTNKRTTVRITWLIIA